MSRNKANEETDKQTRIAIVSDDKCKPKRCRQECKKCCPVVRMGKLCIEVSPNSKIASLSEELCIGCGICVKVGSIGFETIQIHLLDFNTHRHSVFTVVDFHYCIFAVVFVVLNLMWLILLFIHIFLHCNKFWFRCRNAHSMLLWLLTFQAIWKSKQHIVIRRIHSNCIVCRFHVQVLTAISKSIHSFTHNMVVWGSKNIQILFICLYLPRSSGKFKILLLIFNLSSLL